VLTIYRPKPPAVSLLSEIVCADFDQRKRACEALSASIWAYGLNACATPDERRRWQLGYVNHMRSAIDLWTYETTPRP
jgi:hypothetical protein